MQKDDTYLTLEGLSRGLYKEKGSKFIALACPVDNENEVKERLAEYRKDYHDARHHCYAYRIGCDNPVYRVNDDGEPSGSAGRPVYGQILSHELINVLIVVVRYFGGTKLGIPGLINAYKTSAKDAIDNGKIIPRTVKCFCSIHYNYPAMNEVMKILKEENAAILGQEFGNSCKIRFSVRRNAESRVKSRLLGVEGLTLGDEGYG